MRLSEEGGAGFPNREESKEWKLAWVFFLWWLGSGDEVSVV